MTPKKLFTRTSGLGSTSSSSGYTHMDGVHSKPGLHTGVGDTQGPVPIRLEKIQCPKLDLEDGSPLEEKWEYFTFRWKQYKTMVDIAGKEKKNLAIGLGDEMVGVVFHWLGTD